MKKPAFEDALKILAARKRQKLGGHPSPDHLLAYHVGELQSEETERVQDHLAICGECTRFVLSLGPDKSSATQGSPKITAGQVAAAWQDFRSRLDSADTAQQLQPSRKEVLAALPLVLRPQFAYLIAALLLAAAAGLAFRLAMQPLQLDGIAQVYSDSTRGAADAEPILQASAQNPLLILTSLREVAPYSSYSADLLDEEGKLAGQIADPVRLADSFFVQPGQLDPGSYRVSLFGIRGQSREHLADFEFLVR